MLDEYRSLASCYQALLEKLLRRDREIMWVVSVCDDLQDEKSGLIGADEVGLDPLGEAE